MTDLPTRMLNLINGTLNDYLNIESELTVHGETPTLKTEVGNIIYFGASNSFRIFLKEPGPLGVTHITVKGTPEALLKRVKELHDVTNAKTKKGV